MVSPDDREARSQNSALISIMSVKIYVGNLSFETTEGQVRELFSPHGTVTEASLVMDRMSGRSRGFAFVTMDSADAAKAAIGALNGKDLGGRALTVNEARPKTEGGGGGGGGGRGDRRY